MSKAHQTKELGYALDAMLPAPPASASEAIGRYATEIRSAVIWDTVCAKANAVRKSRILGRPLTHAEIINLPGREQQRIGFYDNARTLAKRWGLIPPDPAVLESHTLRRLQAWAGEGVAPSGVDFPNPSAPMSLAKAAERIGGQMSPRKLGKLLKDRTVRSKKLSRERIIFCCDDQPQLSAG